MTPFVGACAAIALIAVGAHFALERADFSTAYRDSDRASVRLGVSDEDID